MKTQITTIEQLKVAMFEFQVKKAWASIETILRRAAGKPDPTRGNLKRATIPLSSRIVLRALLRCFAVDDKLSFRVNGVFDDHGFRKCGYRQFGKDLADRTIAWAIRFLRDCGIITAYQECNPDGSKGQWWVRLNPDVLTYWASHKPQLEAVLVPSPLAINCQLSSSQQGSEAVASQPIAVAPEKKKENTPSGAEVLSSKEGTEAEARRIMMESPVGDVVRKLKGSIPGIMDLTIAELKTIHRWVNHSSPMLRLTPEVVDDLVRMLDEEVVNLDGPRLVAQWYFLAKRLAQWRVAMHDVRMTARQSEFLQTKDTLFSEKPVCHAPEHFNFKNRDAGILNVRRLLSEMKEGGSSSLTVLLAKLVGPFLRSRPAVYKMVWDRVPQIRALCDISFECHNLLIKEAKQFESSICVWDQVKGYYGFEQA